MFDELLPSFSEVFDRVRTLLQNARRQALHAVNDAMVQAYWNIGREILSRQQAAGWGAKIIQQLSQDLHATFPEMKGFSSRNLKYMRALAETYTDEQFVQQLVAQIPWGHNVRILDYVKTAKEREWYIRKTIEHGWSRNILVWQIESKLYKRQGQA